MALPSAVSITLRGSKSIRQGAARRIDVSPDGEAVDGGRAPDAKVMARTAAKVTLWAQRTPQRTSQARSVSSEDTHEPPER